MKKTILVLEPLRNTRGLQGIMFLIQAQTLWVSDRKGFMNKTKVAGL